MAEIFRKWKLKIQQMNCTISVANDDVICADNARLFYYSTYLSVECSIDFL